METESASSSERLASGAAYPGTPPLVPLPPPRSSTSSPTAVPGGVAMSKVETVLLSATGDVLVSRCRESSEAYMVPSHVNAPSKTWSPPKQPGFDKSWWEKNCKGLYTLNQDGTLCPCDDGSTAVDLEYRATTDRGGLLGGNPPKGEASEMLDSNVRSEENNSQQTPAEDTLSSTIPVSPKSPKPENSSSDVKLMRGENLVPLPSFDYSHFAEGGNDMLPSTPESNLHVAQAPVEPTENEKPSFLSSIMEIGEQSGNEALGDSVRTKKVSNMQTHHPSTASIEIPELPNGPSSRRFSIESLKLEEKYDLTPPPVMHGVPIFLSSIPQIRITHVSANPLGSHVLLISAEALLFSFGLNDHGQLGNGRKSLIKDSCKGFVTTPTLVTPLLENGGKAIACAAGVDNSLVVIKTDGRRVGRLQEKDRISRRKNNGNSEKNNSSEIPRVTSSPPRIIGFEDSDHEQSPPNARTELYPDELMCHHQVYGFGRNDCMKLGLVNPVIKDDPVETEDTEEDVLLPRRVALHCNVWPGTTGQPSAGIFAVATSAHHSAALVRRATGAVELYTWGLAEDGALGPHSAADVVSLAHAASSEGLPSQARQPQEKQQAGKSEPEKTQINGDRPKPVPRRTMAIPTIVRKLSYLPSPNSVGVSVASTAGPSAEYPVHIALGPSCTFVVTSKGQCMSFGANQDGMLGLGPGITGDAEPKALSFSDSTNSSVEIKSVSVGARHVVALTRDGHVYSWGVGSGGRLGFECDPRDKPHVHDSQKREGASQSKKDRIQWLPRRIEVPGCASADVSRTKHLRTFSDNALPDSMAASSLDEKRGTKEVPNDNSGSSEKLSEPVVHACAGHDSTVFVTNTGRPLSCGKKSGRLGVGEVNSDVCPPKHMFGGLQLWRQAQP